MARKTFEIEKLKAEVNRRLEMPTLPEEIRGALCSILEHVLMEADAYAGFNWIHWSREGGYEAWDAAGRPEGPEKNAFIYGPEGMKGQYYRRYYY